MIFFYLLAIILFGGLGVTFLNSESLLAFCFFIFFAFCSQNSASLSQSLQHSTEAVRTALLCHMIQASKQNLVAKTKRLAKQTQLLASVHVLTDN
jgi:hypothetical protein